jgi:SAM-dependent methyltransferase
MNKDLQHIIHKLRTEGKDYTQFKTLLNAIEASGSYISKDAILDFLANDYRIQLPFTPNSVAKIFSQLAHKWSSKNAIDICCGTGNILYYLQNEIADLTGVEINENVAVLTKSFIPELQIITADSFKYSFSRSYDLVVGNIPSGMRIELNSKRIACEEAFLRKAYDLLSENGRAIMLVPYSVLLSNQFQKFRTEFISYLEEIITLPAGSFRNAYNKTAIVQFGRQPSDAVRLIQLSNFDSLEKDFENASSIVYSNDKLQERWDPEYHQTRGNSFYKELDSFQTKELQELADIIKGKMIPTDTLKEHGDFLYLKPVHIQKEGLKTETSLKYISNDGLSEKDYRYILQPGDIVISTVFNDLKMYVYQHGDIPAVISNNLAIIRSSKQDYIMSYLQTVEGKRIFHTQAEDLKKGVVIPHLSIRDLGSIKIPILPISDLNKLGDKAIKSATKSELIDQLEVLRSFNPQENLDSGLEVFNEPVAQYNSTTDFGLAFTFIADRLRKIEEQLLQVNTKLDSLVDLVLELKQDFLQVQKLPRDEDEKLFKLYQRIDAKLDVVFKKEQQTIAGYIEEIKRWLDLWELLDVQSQKFLPIAEFIFDELSKLDDADYAPFVVQYCRTLENEILKKLFTAYHLEGLKNVNRQDFLIKDLSHPKTGKFAQMIIKDKVTYTLGDMNFIMTLIRTGGNTLNESKLLQHFREFTISYFDEKIVEAEFLNDIGKITNEFRNKAAHPYSINVDLAKECQGLLRKCLNAFLESIKKHR